MRKIIRLSRVHRHETIDCPCSQTSGTFSCPLDSPFQCSKVTRNSGSGLLDARERFCHYNLLSPPPSLATQAARGPPWSRRQALPCCRSRPGDPRRQEETRVGETTRPWHPLLLGSRGLVPPDLRSRPLWALLKGGRGDRSREGHKGGTERLASIGTNGIRRQKAPAARRRTKKKARRRLG